MTMKQSFLREEPKNINKFFNVSESKKKSTADNFFTELLRKKTLQS